MSIERIIAAVVDTKLLTLYRENGSTIEIPQGDPRVRGIIEQVMPVVQSGGVAEVDLSRLPNAYKEFEEKSSGFVRLFRVAKKAVASIFAEPEPIIEPGVFGSVPNASKTPPTPSTIVGTQPTMAAVDAIIANAESVSNSEYKDADTTADHTMIAVVHNDDQTKTIIPGVESIKEQFGYSAKLGSTKGMENFFKRLAAVIDKRPHSVQDLLRFLEKGDLPIADDGCIVAYKRLFSENNKNTYVDPHTRKVTQRVGSYVCVDDSLVDMSRRNECSNGLHIGRRGYMGGFSGDSMFICKIAPEDVMVVPHNDPNKVRVRGYHIIAIVNEKAFNAICRNQPATSDSATADLLTKIIAGKHPAPDQEVRITKQSGGGLQIRPMANGKVQDNPEPLSNVQHAALDDERHQKSVDVKDVVKQVTAAKGTESRQDKAKALMAIVTSGTKGEAYKASLDLLEMKKKAKVSWDSLGIDEAARQLLVKVSNPEPNAATKEAMAEVRAPKPTPPAKVENAMITQLMNGPIGVLSRKDEVSLLVTKTMNKTLTPNERSAAAESLLTLRRKAKVTWAKLDQPAMTDDRLRTFITEMDELAKATPKVKAAPVAKAKVQAKPEPKAKPVKLDISSAPSAMEKSQNAINTKAKEGSLSVQDHARKFYNEKAWGSLISFKRLKKKSWSALGFTSKEEAEIKLHIGD